MVKAPLPELSSLSDSRLARLLAELTSELQRRKSEADGLESRTELDRAVQEALRTLEGLMPKRTRQARRRTRDDVAPPLQEPKRKAIRAALLAGVAPGQVAKHFGLPLAAVRKVLAQAE